MTFWHVGEYYANTSSFNWHTRIGKFNFVGGGANAESNDQRDTDRYSNFLQLGGRILTCPGRTRGSLGSFSQLTGSFTSWVAATTIDVELTNPFRVRPGG